MEYMDLTLLDFYKFVHNERQNFPEKLLGYISIQILDALIMCKKEHKVMHRDIKPSNILLNEKGKIEFSSPYNFV